MSNEVMVQSQQQSSMQSYCFANAQAFEAAQRMATALSKATLVPKEYINSIPNCIIALEIAHRMNASPTMVMQNLYIVHGRPSWSSQFIISAVNSCGRFRPLRFDLTGEGDKRQCIAWTVERGVDIPSNIQNLDDAKKARLSVLESPAISIDIAKKEGWYGKNGSKWQTMPELMLRYRAASFFGKLYAPEILMGMQTQEEVEDIVPVKDVTPPRDNSSLQDAFMGGATTEESSVTPEPRNKMDEILSPKSAQPEPESPADLALQKHKEIISLLEKAENAKDVDAIMKDNRSHISMMEDDLKSAIWKAADERKRIK